MDSIALQTGENTHHNGTSDRTDDTSSSRNKAKKRDEDDHSRIKSKRKPSINRGQSQSCHQCRQSIFSAKGMQEAKEGKTRTKCGVCTRYWCDNCLHNRYGINTTEISVAWKCPFCMKMCNCSLCRKKAGQLATGILTPLAKTSGFGSVSEYLTNSKDEIAACLQWKAEKEVQTPQTKKRKIVKKKKPRRKSETRKTKSKSPLKPSTMTRSPRNRRYATRLSVSSSSEMEVVSPRRGSDRWSLRPQPRTVTPIQHYNSVGSISECSDEEQEETDVAISAIADETQSSTLVSTVIESPGAPSNVEDSDSDESEAESDERMQKQLQLSFLKRKWKECESEQKNETLQKKRTERQQLKLQLKHKKEEQRAKQKENRKQKRANERILRQEQLRKLVLEKRQQRLLEKQVKEEQLKKLKEQKREEKKRLQTAVNVSLSEPFPVTTDGDKEQNGFLDLPDLPRWNADWSYRSTSQLIELWSFLQQFTEVVNCSAVETLDVLVVNLRGGGSLIDLYCSLLKLLLPEDSPNRAIIDQSLVPLSKGVCNRILSEYVSECIGDCSTLGGLLDTMPPQKATDHLNLLTFLLEKVLLVEEVTEVILKSAEDVRVMKRDLKNWQKLKTKEISDKLMKMNEEQCSMDELMREREDCLEAVRTERNKLLLQQQRAKNGLRISPLGEDRHGRLYWAVPSLPYLLVEDLCRDEWLQIPNKELLEELMASLNIHDDAESNLLSNMAFLQDSLF